MVNYNCEIIDIMLIIDNKLVIHVFCISGTLSSSLYKIE